MKKFLIEDLAKIIGAPLERGAPHASFITGVSINSRTVEDGDCFFAIAGENFDGADFLADAFAKGAACAVVSKKLNPKPYTLYPNKILKVDNTIKALGRFARQCRQQGSFKVVAITGSVGKTTTRQIVYHVLSKHFRVFQAPKNFNNDIGLPLTLLGADPEDEIVLAELASNHPGEIAYLTRIAQPDIAVITNVYPAHLEGFGNLQTIVKEKLSIAEGFLGDGILIINADLVKWLNPPLADQSPVTSYQLPITNYQLPITNYQLPITNYQIMTFGKVDDCNIQVSNITHTSFGSSFTIDGPPPCAKSTQVYLPLPGSGNVENAVAAWAICSQFGININDFAQDVKTLPLIPMRAELMKIGTLTVLNDCYNANPTSMKNALGILVNLVSRESSREPRAQPFGRAGRATSHEFRGKHRGSRKAGARPVFICGDMAELGQQSEYLHAQLGASIAQAKVQLLLAIGKFAKVVTNAAKENARYDLQTKSFQNTLSVCNNLEKFIKDYDIILVKGSRVAKLEMAIEKLKEVFS